MSSAIHWGVHRWQKNPAVADQTRGAPNHKLCQYIRGQSRYGRPRCRLRGAQILSSRLASPAVCNDVEADRLPLVEGAHAGAFDRADMNEDIFVAAFGL